MVAGGAHLPPARPRAVVLSNGDSVDLRGSASLRLSVAEHFALVEEADGWSTSSAAYYYVLGQQGGGELLAFHWHPAGASTVQTPHLHVGVDVRVGARWLPKVHVPTGVVALQDVLALCIEELGVEPLRDDWQVVLDQTRRS